MERDLFSPEFRRRYAEAVGTNGNGDQLDAYLAATLKRARRFHQALDAVEDNEFAVCCWRLVVIAKRR